MPSLQDVWETVLFSPLNLLTEAVSERFLKRDGRGGSRAAKRQNTCYPLVHSIHHAQTHTWTPGWGVQGDGKNKRLESQYLFLILYCTCSQGNSICGQSWDQQKPKAKEYCYFFWCSGCPNRSWGWTVVQGLGVWLQVKDQSWYPCLFFLFVGSKRKIFQKQRMQDFTAAEADKIHAFEMRVLDCNVHSSEYLKNLRDKMSDTLLLSHHSYRCAVATSNMQCKEVQKTCWL